MIYATVSSYSWAASLGGEHYTGTITRSAPWEQVEISHRLTRTAAAKLNRKERGGGYRYKVGDVSERFETKEGCQAAGAKQALETWPDLDFIQAGQHASSMPQRILWARDSALGEKLDRLGKRMEEIYAKTDDPWISHGEETDALGAEWDRLIASEAADG